LATVNEDELPIVVKQMFADIQHQMNRVTPLNGESPICASVRKMSVEEASECAVSIVTVYSEIARLGGAGQTLMPIDGSDKKLVPPFLIKSN
ncbi:MAG: hypothetical protein OER22_12960, partial [Gammaproteobacteria bacterium]|nr:hypothetical protein [Gammaproteobacteria bacterium]